jgi:hypothetical protein
MRHIKIQVYPTVFTFFMKKFPGHFNIPQEIRMENDKSEIPVHPHSGRKAKNISYHNSYSNFDVIGLFLSKARRKNN